MTFIFSSAFAQAKSCCDLSDYSKDSIESLLYPRDIKMEITENPTESFIKWKQRPQSFFVNIFDRFGNSLYQSYDPDFKADAKELKSPDRKKGECLFYMVRIITCAGEKINAWGFLAYLENYYWGHTAYPRPFSKSKT